MGKNDPLDALGQDPKAAALLSDKAALSALLGSQEAKTLAGLFQRLGGAGLQQAAQAAAAGDPSALGAILEKVQADPEGAKAMEAMGRKTGK